MPTNFNFGFKDCRLVEKFLIRIKISSRNAVSETLFDFIYTLEVHSQSPYFSTFSMLNETKLIVFKPTCKYFF